MLYNRRLSPSTARTSQAAPRNRALCLAASLAACLLATATCFAQSTLPDAPVPRPNFESAGIPAGEATETESASIPPELSESGNSAYFQDAHAPVATAPQDTKGPQTTTPDQLKQAEHQRILGVMPAFNSVNGGIAPPLTPRQKFQLMFKSTTDPYVFGFAAFTAGIGQADNSHAAYGQGAEGYFKRFGASYADTADGNFWGNALLPVVLHEDPRYFRLGSGTFTHRLLYSMASAVVCRRDDGTRGPNYANVLGNLIAGGISNAYYPEADRGVGQTFQSAATVTAEGMIGAALLEFWPDIAHHYKAKKQAKLDAARNAQNANPSGKPPQ